MMGSFAFSDSAIVAIASSDIFEVTGVVVCVAVDVLSSKTKSLVEDFVVCPCVAVVVVL